MPNPELHVSFGKDYEIVATPDNTELFRYVAVNAMYNHIFITRSQEGAAKRGHFIRPFDSAWEVAVQFLLDNGYPTHENLRLPEPYITELYAKAVDKMLVDVGDSVPDGWEK